VKPEETIDFPIRWAWYRIARMYNIEAAKYGTTMSVGYALLNIDAEEGTPSTKLGPKMGMEPRSLTRTLKSMEEAGLIKRIPDKKDKRMVRIFLTEMGREKRDQSKEAVLRFNYYVQEKLPKKKLQTFLEVANKINDILDNDGIFENEEDASLEGF
jgi:DNA-binding MarR family transcriptional regulator